eukprot:912848-Rhodomonas_salina.3
MIARISTGHRLSACQCIGSRATISPSRVDKLAAAWPRSLAVPGIAYRDYLEQARAYSDYLEQARAAIKPKTCSLSSHAGTK